MNYSMIIFRFEYVNSTIRPVNSEKVKDYEK